MTAILYSNRFRRVIFSRTGLLTLVLAIASSAAAQYRRPTAQPPRTSPRAVAVLETFEKGPARLYPVSLMLDGKFYDASLYNTKPVPLSLFSETVYEVQKNGTPVGMFTVQRAGRFDTTWFGEGRWKPFADEKDTKIASTPASKDGSKDAKDSAKKDDKTAAVSKPADDPDRPILRKPVADVPATPQVKSDPTISAPPGQDARAAKAANDDPNRPTLRRGRPADADTVEPIPTSPIAGGGIPAKSPASAGMKPTATFVAISDPGSYENHPYEYQANGAEVQHLTNLATKIAVAELRKFASGRGRQLPAVISLTDVETRGFDLDYSNSPYIVLSGQYILPAAPASKRGAPATPQTLYSIFVITRMDNDGTLNKIFAAATDNFHLDVYPQMELIDAVDVDGDGRGELLLRQVFDTTRSYVIYRATQYQVTKLFEGGSGR